MAKIAVLVAEDFEDSELSIPMKRLVEAGHTVEVLGVQARQKLVGKHGKAKVKTDARIVDHEPEEYDALLIPGGHSPDNLRAYPPAVEFVKCFAELGQPIAAICHGPQLLIEAGVVRGRKMTAWDSVRTDLRNAGADVFDEPVVEDEQFITSREPADLEAFCAALLHQLVIRGPRQAAHPVA